MFNSPVQLQLGTQVPARFDPEIRAALDPVYLAINQLASALAQYTGAAQSLGAVWNQVTPDQTLLEQNMCRLYVPFSETVGWGTAVNLYNNAGILTARKANATNNTKPCRGISSISSGVLAGDFSEVMLGGCLSGLSGMTPGANYYLSTTGGVLSAAPAVAAGNIEQYVGFALSSTLLWLNPGTWIQH